jgi:5-methylcytosine-specific restriction endonuclease McrA
MPTGVYQRSPEEKDRLRKMIKEVAPDSSGKRRSIATEFKKGSIPWNKGKPFLAVRGENNPNKRQEVKEKISKTRKARKNIIPYPAGENHPNWKGGKTPLIMKIRNHPKSIQWRNEVFERDGYACKVCGDNQGGNLNAHHYTQLSDLIHTLKITTIDEALNTPILWDIKNGVTLCNKCHPTADEASKLVKTVYGGCYE